MSELEEILAGIPQKFKTLEVDAEKKIFRLNGVDFGNNCDFFSVSCEGGEGFKVRVELRKEIICVNYGVDNRRNGEPDVKKLSPQQCEILKEKGRRR